MGSHASKTLVAFLVALALLPAPAKAMDRDVRSVLVAGGYGLVTGTVLGLATMPFAGKPRIIFIGSSVGLYLGLALGMYYVFDRQTGDRVLRQTYGGLELAPSTPGSAEPAAAAFALRSVVAARTVPEWESLHLSGAPPQLAFTLATF